MPALPPREPPSSLLQAFTLNGTVPFELYYVDDSSQGRGMVHMLGKGSCYSLRMTAGTHYKYSLTDLRELTEQAQVFLKKALSLPPPSPPRTISPSTWRTQLSDIWLVHALHHYPLTGHSVVSSTPSPLTPSHHSRLRLCLAPPTPGTRASS